jgi:hypothetical protein
MTDDEIQRLYEETFSAKEEDYSGVSPDEITTYEDNIERDYEARKSAEGND